MSAEKIREKRWWRKEELWHCVDLVATFLCPPPFLLLVLSFFPPVLQGIKTSIHVPEETHSRREKREAKGEEKREDVKVGQFVDHWDQARLPKIVCVCACMSLFTQRVLPVLYYLRSVPAKASSGKVGWESLEIGPHSRFPLLD